MIRNFFDISTAHVSEATRDWLDEQGRIAAAKRTDEDPDPALLIGSTPYGWFVYADEDSCLDAAAAKTLFDQRASIAALLGTDEAKDAFLTPTIEKFDLQLKAYIGDDGGALPSDLWFAMMCARAHGCDYILFDRDGTAIDALPVFEDEAAAPVPAHQERPHVH